MARRARRERETVDYVSFARRVIRGAGRRVGDADEVELAQLVELRDELETAIRTAVEGQRSIGRSWAYIGAALGITRQSAQERYGTPRFPEYTPNPDGVPWVEPTMINE